MQNYAPPTPKYGGTSVPWTLQSAPSQRKHTAPWNDAARAGQARAEAQRKVGSGEWSITPATPREDLRQGTAHKASAASPHGEAADGDVVSSFLDNKLLGSGIQLFEGRKSQ